MVAGLCAVWVGVLVENIFFCIILLAAFCVWLLRELGSGGEGLWLTFSPVYFGARGGT